MKASDKKDKYLIAINMPVLNGFENIVENEAFAFNEQTNFLLNFPFCWFTIYRHVNAFSTR